MRITLILFCLFTQLSAQTFVAEGSLPQVKRDGFYRVAIVPDVAPFLHPSFGNLRIVDDTGKEAPYIIEEEAPTFSIPQFKEYKIIKKEYQKGCCTKLILSNPERRSISNISLQIKNAETNKEATLLGSDDRKTWYALKEHFYLSAVDGGNQTFEIRILDFPLSNYPFLSLTLNDSTSAPLNIITAGYYDVNTVSGMYSKVPSLKFSAEEKTKDKQTLLSIRLDTPRLIDKLEFVISGPPFYHRYATLYETGTRLNKKKKPEHFRNYVKEVELTSTHAATVSMPGMKYQNLLLVVENHDNPSLRIDSVRAFQLNRYATAYLKKGIGYKLKVGDPKMTAPVYDLNFFRDSIPNQPTVLFPSNMKAISQTKGDKSITLFTNTQIIWVAIVLVAIVLGYMSVKMIKERGEKVEP